MRSIDEATAPDPESVIATLDELVTSLGWRLHAFNRDDESVGLVSLGHDPFFEQIIWIYDTKRALVRCLLVGRERIPANREAIIFELCARINDGLIFGCAEYSFSDCALVFRDTAPVGAGNLKEILTDLSGRVLNLGARYRPVIAAALAGSSAIEAMTYENSSEGNGAPEAR
ncbi:YbjN domain-containing protein [Burkholderia sp. Bp8963]|uniref:YbjN domain-containing protein n=1 Tax=Burkholderia sp. Bp8963 TaxID=2184547 RepID=UPI000F5AF451|nr:YbjN domain-containing protein [Burkholderia sp. Bp8963]